MPSLFRRKRGDTTVGSIEQTYGIDLHARSDMRLDTLLAERRFDSLSQLRQAYAGNLTYHASPRHVFLSFHADDLQQVRGMRLMMANPRMELDLHDNSVRSEINSESGRYLR